MFPDCAEARRIDSDLAIYILLDMFDPVVVTVVEPPQVLFVDVHFVGATPAADLRNERRHAGLEVNQKDYMELAKEVLKLK